MHASCTQVLDGARESLTPRIHGMIVRHIAGDLSVWRDATQRTGDSNILPEGIA